MLIRNMTIADYDQVYQLWMSINGFGIRSLDDSREGIDKFIQRNPRTCVVVAVEDQIVGSILCGHDGRRGCFYHVCVAKSFRKQGIGSQMVSWCLAELKKEGVNKINLVAFTDNQTGNQFWHREGWALRENLNYYELSLNDQNITNFNRL